MKYWFGHKAKKEGSVRRSFPASKAELTGDVVKDIPELEIGLRAFAERLSEQMGVKGVELHAITFTVYGEID